MSGYITPEVLIAAITTIGGMFGAYWGVMRTKQASSKERRAKAVESQAMKEVSRHSKALDFGAAATDWGELLHDLDALMRDTVVDRFLILRAWNGRLEPRWTTAIFQYRRGNQEPISYVSFELDDDYINRLATVLRRKQHYFRVEDEKPSRIKSVYDMEGVKASLWVLIDKTQYADNTAAITYCSFSTHEPTELDEPTKTRCQLIADKLSGMSRMMKDA